MGEPPRRQVRPARGVAELSLEARDVQYSVAQTGIQYELPPVRFSIESGRGFRFQDYLTPDEAVRLADALREQARIALGIEPVSA